MLQINTLKKRLIVFLFTFGLLACFSDVSAQNWNVNLLKSINPEHPNSSYWKNTSNSAYYFAGAASVGTLIYGIASDDEQVRNHAYEAILSIGGSALISEILKRSFNEERPGDKYPGIIFPSSPAHGKSFPSGHTTLAFATATTLSLEYKKWYVTAPAFLWAGSVGYSRLYLGKHYPSDVLAGGVLGAGSSLACHWLNQKLFKHTSHVSN